MDGRVKQIGDGGKIGKVRARPDLGPTRPRKFVLETDVTQPGRPRATIDSSHKATV